MASRAGGSGDVVPEVEDMDVDSESTENQGETESESDYEIEELLRELSIFVEESDSSDESLLDLDEFGACGLNDTTVRLHEMIDTCHDLEETQGFSPQEDKILINQVKQSAKLLEAQFMPNSKILEINKTRFRRPSRASTETGEGQGSEDEDGSTPGGSRSRSRTRSRSRGNTSQRDKSSESNKTKKQSKMTIEQQENAEAMKPSLMYLAYKHTNMCAHLMQKRTETIGLEESSIDDYIEGLMSMAEAATANDEKTSVNRQLHKLVSGPWKTAPSITAVIGSFDHKEYLAQEHVVVDKPVKKEVKRRQKHFDPDALVATQTEVNISKEDSAAKSKANDEVVKEFRKTLIGYTAGAGKESVNIHEFTLNPGSVRESLNNMFGVAFGVRDGTIALNLEDNQMKIAPIKAAPKDEQNMSNRRQCIMSISAATIRKLQEIAEGEAVIKPQSKPIGKNK